ncbi:hypothetical protein ACWATR_40040 [Nostoc sp. UIC 10890]
MVNKKHRQRGDGSLVRETPYINLGLLKQEPEAERFACPPQTQTNFLMLLQSETINPLLSG